MKRVKVYFFKLRLKLLDKKMPRTRADKLRKTIGLFSEETLRTVVSKDTLALFHQKEYLRNCMQSIENER